MLLMGFLCEMCLSKGPEERGRLARPCWVRAGVPPIGVWAPRLCTSLPLGSSASCYVRGTKWSSALAGLWCRSWELLFWVWEGTYTGAEPSGDCQGQHIQWSGVLWHLPRGLCTGTLFACKTHSTKTELIAFQKIYSYLSGINEKVVSLENIRTVFSLNKQMMFAVLILLIGVVHSLIIPFARTAAIIWAEVCCSDSAGWMWLWSREFISPVVRIWTGDVPQNKILWILADLACAGICCPGAFNSSAFKHYLGVRAVVDAILVYARLSGRETD